MSDRLNALERRIVGAEDAAEEARWEQAEEVVRLLDDGTTHRDVAAGWINGRTGEPYKHAHVTVYSQVWQKFGWVPSQDRPLFKDAYAELRPTTRSERNEAQAPTTVESAERLVRHLADAPPDVQEVIFRGVSATKYRETLKRDDRERRHKEADAFAHTVTQPMKDALDMTLLVLHIEEVTEEVHEVGARMSEADRDELMRAVDALAFTARSYCDVVTP